MTQQLVCSTPLGLELPSATQQSSGLSTPIVCSIFADNVHDSQAYKNIDITSDLRSLTFVSILMFLSFQIGLSLASADVA